VKAILYARFSPRPNAADCESCETQLEDMRQWCTKHGHEIVGEFQDRALSGGDAWDTRPGMMEAAAMAKRGNLFLVRSYDRLFRDTDKALAFRAKMEVRGVQVQSITEEAANGNEMHAKLIRFVFLWVAEYQRELIKARTRMRMRQHQRNGRRMSRIPPFGWRDDPDNDRRLIEDECEQDAIRAIVAMDADGLGPRPIARALAEANVPCRGGRWQHSLVRRVLRRHAATE